ncbi:MAG: B12-binding domain-containing radical SAM protein [Deltaproteobacteria bacterium]|nr:B12-binding domain-containing radical SAM protein [Deltaproteobacteria bacterium]
MSTSRGCPWTCHFCDQTIFGHKYRTCSPKRIYQMMAHLNVHYGIRDVAFHDEMFLIDEKKIVELCQHVTRGNLDMTWCCQLRADLRLTEFTLNMMREAGCWQIQFGVESGSDEILRRMNKDLTSKDLREGIARVRAAGIRTKGFLMVGYPGETEATLAETERFILDCAIDDVMIG